MVVERLVGLAVAVPPLMNRAALGLARRKDLADLLVGVAGDFVPPREVLRPGYVARLVAAALGLGTGDSGLADPCSRVLSGGSGTPSPESPVPSP